MSIPYFPAPQGRLHRTEIVIAMKPRDARAATTSIIRAETLAAEGYRFKRVRPGVVEVKGKPTTHRRRDGSTRIDPHGPYTVDTVAETCPCLAFGYRGVCPHILPAQEFEAALERGESMEVRATRIDSDMIVLREIGGERLLCRDGRVIVFRSYETAASYWSGRRLVETCEIAKATVQQLQESKLYIGMHLVTDRQDAPIDFGFSRPAPTPRPYQFPQMEDYDNAA